MSPPVNYLDICELGMERGTGEVNIAGLLTGDSDNKKVNQSGFMAKCQGIKLQFMAFIQGQIGLQCVRTEERECATFCVAHY